MNKDRFKFRGRGIDNGGGYAGIWFTGFFWETPTIGKTYITHWHEKHGRLFDYEIDPKTVGQCTGLKDKNGKLIFEGDIINGCKGSINGCDWPWGPYEIKWVNESAEFNVPTWGTYENQNSTHWFEIIGNVHESEVGNE